MYSLSWNGEFQNVWMTYTCIRMPQKCVFVCYRPRCMYVKIYCIFDYYYGNSQVHHIRLGLGSGLHYI